MYKVIIADDKALIRAGLFYRNNWKEMGYEVTALLEDGSDVLNFLQKERVDVLLADICMHSVSGLEVAKVIQEHYPWMKVVLISGYQDFEFAKDAIRYRVYDYLLKPIDYEKLKKVFAKIKIELDESKKTRLIKKYFHEKEYDQILYLLQHFPEKEYAEEKSWENYTELWSIFSKNLSSANVYVALEMLQLLEAKIERLDKTLKEEFDKRLLETEDYTEESFGVLLQWLEKELEGKGIFRTVVKKDEEILRACNYIRDHLSENLSLEKVATYIHLSTRQFSRKFFQQNGENFKDYLYRVRMEKAVSLVEQGEMSMKEICEMVGYTDYKYFRQLLKKYTGDKLRKR